MASDALLSKPTPSLINSLQPCLVFTAEDKSPPSLRPEDDSKLKVIMPITLSQLLVC